MLPVLPGPYLRWLEHLEVEAGTLGSLAAVWQCAPQLASLRLAGCPWLQVWVAGHSGGSTWFLLTWQVWKSH